MSTAFQQQAASLPIECVARRLSRATTLARQPACAQAVAIRRRQYSRLLRNGILPLKRLMHTGTAEKLLLTRTVIFASRLIFHGIYIGQRSKTTRRGESPSHLSVIGGALLHVKGTLRLSVVRNSEVVRYSGAENVLRLSTDSEELCKLSNSISNG